MFPKQILFTYVAAVLLIVISPGPDNILVISRGLSQGRLAAALSAIGASLGIMVHTTAAALGLALVLQTSPLAFWLVKAAGATAKLGAGLPVVVTVKPPGRPTTNAAVLPLVMRGAAVTVSDTVALVASGFTPLLAMHRNWSPFIAPVVATMVRVVLVVPP